MLAVSAMSEYAFVPMQNIEHIGELYRLMPVRYLMVLYLGCVWPMLKDKQKYILYGVAGICAFMILNDVYLLENVQIANALMGGLLLRIGMGIIGILLLMYLYLWHYWNGYDM